MLLQLDMIAFLCHRIPDSVPDRTSRKQGSFQSALKRTPGSDFGALQISAVTELKTSLLKSFHRLNGIAFPHAWSPQEMVHAKIYDA